MEGGWRRTGPQAELQRGCHTERAGGNPVGGGGGRQGRRSRCGGMGASGVQGVPHSRRIKNEVFLILNT